MFGQVMTDQDHDQFYLDTFVPINSTSGTQYETCSPEEIHAYTCPTPRLGRLLLKIHATRLLNSFLTNQWPNQRAREALNRIKRATTTPGWGPDLLVKLMPDTDEAFFKGRLRSHVQISWEDNHTVLNLQQPALAFAASLGVTSFDSVNRICYIHLNRDRVCYELDPREAMLQTLIHEMVHAWEYLYCRREPQDSIDSYEEWASNHGWHWRWILNLVDRRTQSELGFGAIAQWEDQCFRIADMAHARQSLPL